MTRVLICTGMGAGITFKVGTEGKMANTIRKIGKYGKSGPQFPEGLKELKAYAKKDNPLPSPPSSVDFYAKVAAWPMDGNDRYGDCTMAAAAHCIQQWNGIAATPDPVPSEQDVVSQYLKLTHGKDTGLVESNVLSTWKNSGLWQNRILGYAPVNVHDNVSVQQAVYLFGAAYVGIQVPANAESQFEGGKPWTLESGWQKEAIQGGHAIPFVGYDADWLYCITWGAVQKVAWDWWQTYGDEAWAILAQEFREAKVVNNIDFDSLLADLPKV